MSSIIQFLNPPGLHHNPAWSHQVSIQGSVKTVYIGGQNALNAKGEVVGKGDMEAQTRQVLENIQANLKAAGAGLQHVVKWTLLVVQGQDLQKGFKVFQEVMKDLKNPPLITMAFVAGLANPDFLLEMEVMAVVPIEADAHTTP